MIILSEIGTKRHNFASTVTFWHYCIACSDSINGQPAYSWRSYAYSETEDRHRVKAQRRTSVLLEGAAFLSFP